MYIKIVKIVHGILIFLSIAAIAALTLYNLSEEASSFLIWPYFISIPVIYGLFRMGRALKNTQIRKLLDKSWSQPAVLPMGVEISNIKSAYEKIRRSRNLHPAAEIDNGSWSDFNLDEIYQKLNYCLSVPGFYYLYEGLRNPLTDIKQLDNRERQISFFEEESEKSFHGICEKAGRALLPLHTVEHLDILRLIDRKNDSGRLFPLCTAMRIAAFASIGGFFLLNLQTAILIFFAVFIINLILSSVLKKRTKGAVPALSGMLRMIKAAERVDNINFTDSSFNELSDKIKEKTAVLKKIKSYGRFLYQKTVTLDNPVDILWMYLDIFFLIEAIAFYRSLSFIQSHRADVIELFCRLGEVDFLRSTAALREALAADRKICCPEFSGLKSINSTEVYHPLIDSAVENDISLKSPGLLLTGANMAGKSTFLRTIGVNCILSQSILTVFADRWESDVFIIKSSIEKQDSIISGKSFYYAEAERVGKILNLASESNLPVLCLFDELLSGTNTEEREAAVTSIIRGAASMNTLCLAATHDRKVVDEFHNSFLLKHFTYRFDESGLVFDYKLQDGRVQNGNAIELLKYLGYPGKIVDDAFELIRR